MTPDEAADDRAEIRVQLARFEAKLDVAIAQHGAKLDEHDRAIADLRDERKAVVSRLDAQDGALDSRVRELEKMPTVTQKQLAAVAAGVVGVVGALSPLLERLYS